MIMLPVFPVFQAHSSPFGLCSWRVFARFLFIFLTRPVAIYFALHRFLLERVCVNVVNVIVGMPWEDELGYMPLMIVIPACCNLGVQSS